MDERLKGTWYSSEEDIELQRRFWELFKVLAYRHDKPTDKIDLHIHQQDWFRVRIGSEFLRQNQNLLRD